MFTSMECSALLRVQQNRSREEFDPDGDRALVRVEIPLMQIAPGVVTGIAHSEPGHGAGYVLQVPREVLAAEALLRVLQRVRAAAGRHGAAQQVGRGDLVD